MTAPERACGACRACCVALAIVGEPRIGLKEMFEPCRHLRPNRAGCCGIYPARPRLCQAWRCCWRAGWLAGADRPDRSGVLVAGNGSDVAVLALDEAPATEEAALRIALELEASGLAVRLSPRGDHWTRAQYLAHLGEWLEWLLAVRSPQ